MTDPAGSQEVQFGFRRYDPATRQWASQDPAFFSEPYRFDGDNPLAYSDPMGLMIAPGDGPPRDPPPTTGGSASPSGGDRPDLDDNGIDPLGIRDLLDRTLDILGTGHLGGVQDRFANSLATASELIARAEPYTLGILLPTPGAPTSLASALATFRGGIDALNSGYGAYTGHAPGGRTYTTGQRVYRGVTAAAFFLPMLGALRGASQGSRALTAFHGAPGDNILGIIARRGFIPGQRGLYLSRDVAGSLSHGADTVRRASFVIEAEVSTEGAMVTRGATEGAPLSILVQSDRLIPAQVLRMFVRTGSRAEGFSMEVVEGERSVVEYLTR